MKKAVIVIIVLALIGACAAGAVAYHNNKIKEMREAGNEKLKASVSLDDYSKDQQKEVTSIVDVAEKKIGEAKKQEDVDAALEEASALIQDVKTLEQLRTEGREKLDGIVKLDKYREEQQKEVKKILADAGKKIDKAESEEDIDKIIKNAKSSVKKVKTDAELKKEEEEAAAKAAAAARAAAAKRNSGKKKSSRSRGCVGDSSKNYY